MSSEGTAEWAARVRAGDRRALAHALTAVENRSPSGLELLDHLFPHTGHAQIVGITGAPGAGKSTLIDQLASQFRSAQQTVAVLAVDPSSPFTGGALLGDRIRMQEHHHDPGVYVRSIATRGSLGGLALAAHDLVLVFDAAGFQNVLVETVGVGQAEIDVVRLAEIVLLVLVPGMGDEVQALKAGVMEIADVFVLNKSDRGAESLEADLRAQLALRPEMGGWQPPIVRTTATTGEGVGDLRKVMQQVHHHLQQSGDLASRRRVGWRQRLLLLLQEELLRRAARQGLTPAELERWAAALAARQAQPQAAVRALLGN